jgi:hypothetical protein
MRRLGFIIAMVLTTLSLRAQYYRDFNCSVSINGQYEIYTPLEQLDQLKSIKAKKTKKCSVVHYYMSTRTSSGFESKYVRGSKIELDSLKYLANRTVDGIILFHRICGEDLSTGMEVCFNDVVININSEHSKEHEHKILYKKKLRSLENISKTHQLGDVFELFEYLNYELTGFSIRNMNSGEEKTVNSDELYEFNIRDWLVKNAKNGQTILLSQATLIDFNKSYIHPPYVFEYLE